MKHILLSTVIAFTALPAWAQSSATSDSAAQSQVAVGVQSNSTIYEDNRSVSNYEDRKTRRLETTGNAVPPDMGSGHPCAIGGSIGIGIVGGALAGGLMQVDEACMMVRSGDPAVQAAGWALYASRDADACKALRSTGVIAASSACGGEPAQLPATASTRNAPTRPQARPVSLDVECRRTGNKITPVTTKAVMDFYGRDAVMGACK